MFVAEVIKIVLLLQKKVNDVFNLTLKSFKRQIKLYTAVLEVYGTKITLKGEVY